MSSLPLKRSNTRLTRDRHKCLNWSVEWIVPSTGQKIVRPCLETIPLKEAYDRNFPAPKSEINNIPTEEQRPSSEDINMNTDSHRNIYFYLHRHRAATINIVLVPLQPSATLRDVLRGKSVLEFPTIYILNDDLHRRLRDAKTSDANMSAPSMNKGKFVLEEVYLRDHPDEAGSESGGEEAEEDEDYTSSEGSSSDASSDDDDEDKEEPDCGSELEAEATSVLGPGSAKQDELLADKAQTVV